MKLGLDPVPDFQMEVFRTFKPADFVLCAFSCANLRQGNPAHAVLYVAPQGLAIVQRIAETLRIALCTVYVHMCPVYTNFLHQVLRITAVGIGVDFFKF